MQQNLVRQWQLWPDVLRPWLQRVHREAGGALPLQVSLVLLRNLQDVRAQRGEIRLQMSPPTCRPDQQPAGRGFRLTKALKIQRRLTSVLSFSTRLSVRSGPFLCQCHFCFPPKSPNYQLGFWAFALHKPGVWRQCQSVHAKSAVLLGNFFLLLMIINPPNRATGSKSISFYL